MKNQFIKRLELSNRVKWRLFNRLWKECDKINYNDYKQYRREFEQIPRLLIDEWNKIKEELKNNPSANFKSLRGFLLEALFYYACLETEATLKDAEILGIENFKLNKDNFPPWFEATPLYDVIPPLHHIHKGRKKKMRSPQTRCDFLVTYIDDKGPLPPALVDVKSSRPRKNYIEKFGWQIISAIRRGFIFQFVYPKQGIEYPKSLKAWVQATYCSECKGLSESYRKCDKCGADIIPFTIIDRCYK